MKIGLANLTPEGTDFSGEDPQEEAFAWEDGPGDIVHPAGPLKWALNAKLFGAELLVEGRASAVFEGFCARCGGDMSVEISEPVCFSVEVSAEMSEVDLTSELRDAILLALPNHPLCRPDCKGVCPSCGKPLSEGPCTCGDNVEPSAWDALDGLAQEQSEEKQSKQ